MNDFLKNRQRQPKLFIDLPSYGKYYDDSVVQDAQYTSLPVFGMNAMDEIMLKTPDALFTGESTALIIKSCIPAIIDPWKLVGYDIDHVLLSIRIATYGDKMPITSNCPVCRTETTVEINVNKVLDTFLSLKNENFVTIEDLRFNLKPLTYRAMTDYSHKQYSLDKQLVQISQSKDDDNKEQMQQEIIKKLTNLNLEVAIAYVNSIQDVNAEDNTEYNVESIQEFILNNDAEFFNKLVEKVKEMTNAWSLPSFDISCEDETCDSDWKTQLKVDYSSFFGTNSFHSRNLIS